MEKLRRVCGGSLVAVVVDVGVEVEVEGWERGAVVKGTCSEEMVDMVFGF